MISFIALWFPALFRFIYQEVSYVKRGDADYFRESSLTNPPGIAIFLYDDHSSDSRLGRRDKFRFGHDGDFIFDYEINKTAMGCKVVGRSN